MLHLYFIELHRERIERYDRDMARHYDKPISASAARAGQPSQDRSPPPPAAPACSAGRVLMAVAVTMVEMSSASRLREHDSWLGVEVRHLAALRAISEEGSFGAAALSLGYAQSAISQQVAALERHVGRGSSIAPAGLVP